MAKQKNKGKGDKLVCDICGKGGALLRHVTRSYGKGANPL